MNEIPHSPYPALLLPANTHTHTHEYYSAIKKYEMLPSAETWIDPETIILGEISQTEKDK